MNSAMFLTGLRLLLVPVFLWLFWHGRLTAAFVVFIIAALTDLIDGTVARMFGRPSRFGAILDPIADEMLVEGAFFSLWLSGVLPLWFFVIAFVRDVFIISGIFYLEIKKIEFEYRPSWSSKFATLFQSVVVCFGILKLGSFATSWPWGFLWPAGIYVTAALIVASGFVYFRRGLALIGKKK